MVGARNLWIAGPHTGEGISLAVGMLVRKGGMGGVGCAEYAAEGGGLSTGQGAYRGDRGGGTMLVKGPLGMD